MDTRESGRQTLLQMGKCYKTDMNKESEQITARGERRGLGKAFQGA